MSSRGRFDGDCNDERDYAAVGRGRFQLVSSSSDDADFRLSARQHTSSHDTRCRRIAGSDGGGHFPSQALVTRVRHGLSMG